MVMIMFVIFRCYQVQW